jgi:hypothetical protein
LLEVAAVVPGGMVPVAEVEAIALLLAQAAAEPALNQKSELFLALHIPLLSVLVALEVPVRLDHQLKALVAAILSSPLKRQLVVVEVVLVLCQPD